MHAYTAPEQFPVTVLKALRHLVEDGWKAKPVQMACGIALKIQNDNIQTLKNFKNNSEIIIAPHHVKILISQGVVKQVHNNIIVDTDTQNFLKRVSASALPIDSFLHQHVHISPAIESLRPNGSRRGLNNEDKKLFVKETSFNRSESPLNWLAKRTEKDGSKYLEPHHILAAERLREDFTFGQLMPSMSINWSLSSFAGVSTSRVNKDAAWTESTLAARQRFNAALKEVGTDFSGILVDVCCFLKPIKQIEMEREWPARSAKVVIKFALSSLANHYGLTSTTNRKC